MNQPLVLNCKLSGNFGLLYANQFSVDGFSCPVSDVVHTLRQAICFQPFVLQKDPLKYDCADKENAGKDFLQSFSAF